MKNVAIIPARSGSKGLKDKNIKFLNGKPMIAYTIEAAVKSEVFETVIVSTDSEEYAEISRKYGAEVPFLRSETNSSDIASSWETVKEVIENLKKKGCEYETFALLQPTSPLRDYKDILMAYKYMEEKRAEAVVGVCEAEHSPLWCNTLPQSKSLQNFQRFDINKNRQRLEPYYRINGAIYLSKINTFLENENIYTCKSYAYVMSKMHSIDVDDDMDFKMAQFLIQEAAK